MSQQNLGTIFKCFLRQCIEGSHPPFRVGQPPIIITLIRWFMARLLSHIHMYRTIYIYTTAPLMGLRLP